MEDVTVCSNNLREVINDLLKNNMIVKHSLEKIGTTNTFNKPFSKKKLKIIKKILNDIDIVIPRDNLLKNIINVFFTENEEIIEKIETRWNRFGGKKPPSFIQVKNFINFIYKERRGNIRSLEGILFRIKQRLLENNIEIIFGFPKIIEELPLIHECVMFNEIYELWEEKIVEIDGFRGILSEASDLFYKDNVARILDISNRLSKEQYIFISKITDNMKKSECFACILNAPTGAGKSLIQALIFRKLWKEKYILIYSSASAEVRRNQASLLLSCGIKTYDGTLQSFGFKYNKKCFIYVVHPNNVEEIISNFSSKKILLSIDEPDFGAVDKTEDFLTIMRLIKTMKIQCLILSSATIPQTPKLMEFLNFKFDKVECITWSYRIPNKLFSGEEQIAPLSETYFQRFIEPSMVHTKIIEFDIDANLEVSKWNLNGIFTLYKDVIFPEIDVHIDHSIMNTSLNINLWMKNVTNSELALVICKNPLTNFLSSSRSIRIRAFKELNEIDSIPNKKLLEFVLKEANTVSTIIDKLENFDYSKFSKIQEDILEIKNQKQIDNIKFDFLEHFHNLYELNPIITNEIFDISDIQQLCNSLLCSTNKYKNNILLLGFMGIGIIQDDLEKEYTDFVRRNIGILFSILYVGKEWCFGVNIDPSITYLDDDLELTFNEFIQAAGRSGRGTRHDHPGMVFASSEVINNVFTQFEVRETLPDFIAIEEQFNIKLEKEISHESIDEESELEDWENFSD